MDKTKEVCVVGELQHTSNLEQVDYSILEKIQQELKKDFESKQLYACQLARSYGRIAKDETDLNKKEEYNVKSISVDFCGSYLDFAIGGFYENGDFEQFKRPRLYHANFCKDRLCPMCNARRSKKLTAQLIQIMELLQDKYIFAFLTLTIPNVQGQELKASLDELQDAWNRFSRYTKFKKVVQGYCKALEITQTNKDGSFHPHYHIILALDKQYLKSAYYLRQDEWQDLWCKATGKDVKAVDIRLIKPKNARVNAIVSAVIETAKYMVKPSDYLRGDDTPTMSKKTDNLVKTLNVVLKKERLISFGGCFLQARKQLKQDDENGNLTESESATLKKYYALLLEHYHRRPQQITYERIDETEKRINYENE